jgi:N-acetylmuramoyl-L-alanine amidase
MRARFPVLLLLLGGLLLVLPAAAAPRVVGYDLTRKGGTIGQVARLALDDAGYVSAERLGAVLRGTWTAKSNRGVLTVGKRTAQFVQHEPRVVIQGQAVALDGAPRQGASGWLLPEDFLAKGLARLAPGVSAAPRAAPAAPAREAAAREPLPPPAVREPLPPPATREPAAGDDPPRAGAREPAAREAQAPAAPAKPPTVEELRFRSYPSYTRVVHETGAPVTIALAQVRDEVQVRLPRLALDGARVHGVGDGLVRDLTLAPAGAEAVLRAALESRAGEVKAWTLQDPARVVVDIYRPREPVVSGERAVGQPLRTIVIDPGHGGQDPGAIGPSGVAEKDVVLDVARRVARLAEDGLGVKVLMTRGDDTFIPLRDRTSFANKQRADLFVSIHANAHPRSVSEGVEVYFLSSEASDKEARQVAAIENRATQLENPASRPKGDVLKAILWELAQSEFQRDSSHLAETVLDSMTQSLRLVPRGVKQAGFYVLGGAAMPAILIEIGFLTNHKEERKLGTAGHREAVARAIYAGLADYKRRHDQRLRTANRAEVGAIR